MNDVRQTLLSAFVIGATLLCGEQAMAARDASLPLGQETYENRSKTCTVGGLSFTYVGNTLQVKAPNLPKFSCQVKGRAKQLTFTGDYEVRGPFKDGKELLVRVKNGKREMVISDQNAITEAFMNRKKVPASAQAFHPYPSATLPPELKPNEDQTYITWGKNCEEALVKANTCDFN